MEGGSMIFHPLQHHEVEVLREGSRIPQVHYGLHGAGIRPWSARDQLLLKHV